MSYLLSVFWAWLFLALAGGAIVGWVTWSISDKPRFGGGLPYVALAFVIALAVALTRLLSDVPALWLETALLFAVAYFIGCCFGSVLKSQRKAEPVTQVAGEGVPSTPVDATEIAPSTTRSAALAEAEPAASPPVAGEDRHAGRRPRGLIGPRGGKADDLKLIRGIGPQNEGRLHALGIWHFAQIAAWTPEEVSWIGSYLAFPGRIEREGWRGQAQQLANVRPAEFATRAERGEVSSSRDNGSQGQGNVAKLDKPPKTPGKKT